MRVRENVGVFNYQSGNSQGSLIRVLDMNPGTHVWSNYEALIKNNSMLLLRIENVLFDLFITFGSLRTIGMTEIGWSLHHL